MGKPSATFTAAFLLITMFTAAGAASTRAQNYAPKVNAPNAAAEASQPGKVQKRASSLKPTAASSDLPETANDTPAPLPEAALPVAESAVSTAVAMPAAAAAAAAAPVLLAQADAGGAIANPATPASRASETIIGWDLTKSYKCPDVSTPNELTKLEATRRRTPQQEVRLSSLKEEQKKAQVAADLCKQNATDVQRELQRIGCYAGDLDGQWGDGTADGFTAFLQNSQLDYDYENASKNEKNRRDKEFSKEMLFLFTKLFKTQPGFDAAKHKTRDARDKARADHVNQYCAKAAKAGDELAYVPWDLTRAQREPKKDRKQAETALMKIGPNDAAYEAVRAIRKRLADIKCLDGSESAKADEGIFWDDKAAEAFVTFVLGLGDNYAFELVRYKNEKATSTGAAGTAISPPDADDDSLRNIYKPSHSLVQVLNLLKANENNAGCAGSLLAWDPTRSFALPLGALSEAQEMQSGQAERLQSELVRAGCLKPEAVLGTTWGDDSVKALQDYFSALGDKNRPEALGKDDLKNLKGSSFSRLINRFGSHVSGNDYVCDLPNDYLRECRPAAANSPTAWDTTREWVELWQKLPVARQQFKGEELKAMREPPADVALWIKDKWKQTGDKLEQSLQDLSDHMKELNRLRTVEGARTDCGRCQLVRAYFYLFEYTEFVNLDLKNDLFGGLNEAAIDDKREQELLKLEASFRSYGNDKSAEIEWSKITLRMVEYALPTIMSWRKEWKKYLHGVARHRVDDEQYRIAMAALGAVIQQLNDAKRDDDTSPLVLSIANSAGFEKACKNMPPPLDE